MRVLLAILVTVAQVAGPWLCCCGPDRLFAAASPARSEAPAKPVKLAPGGCPHCQGFEDDGPSKPSEPASPDAPGPCPCGGFAIDAVPPVIDRDIAAVADPLPTPVVFVLAPTAAVPAASPADTVRSSDLPFLPTAVRLYAHHALRC